MRGLVLGLMVIILRGGFLVSVSTSLVVIISGEMNGSLRGLHVTRW